MKLWSAALLFATTDAFRAIKQRARNQTGVPDDDETDVATVDAASEAEVAPSGDDSSIESCKCRFSRYPYQVWPRNQAGSGCIGGCGGAEFQINRHGATIKQLTVWTAGGRWDLIKAIRFTYHDDHRVVKGRPEGAGGPWSFTFAPGEYVVGDLALSGDGRGLRLGSIKFTTSAGNTFDVGLRKPYRYLFPSGGSYITGFMGRAGDDIDMLGVIFWKPITSISLENLTYPTLSSLPALSNPKQVTSRTYCNSLPMPVPVPVESINKTVTTGFETCLNTSTNLQFAGNIKINGLIPQIGAKYEGEAKWDLRTEINTTNCKQYTETRNRSLVFPAMEVPATTSFNYVYTQFSGTLNALPYTAKLRIQMSDGTSFVRTESGVYTGVSYDDVHHKFFGHNSNVRSC